MFKRLGVAALVVAFGITCGSRAQDDPKGAREEKVRRLLRAMGAYELAKAQYDAMIRQFASNPAMSKELVAKIREISKPDDLVELTVPSYVENVSDEDVDALVAFYESPAAKRFVGATPKIQKAAMNAGMKWGAELSLRAMKALQDDKKSDDDEDETPKAKPAPKKPETPKAEPKKDGDF